MTTTAGTTTGNTFSPPSSASLPASCGGDPRGLLPLRLALVLSRLPLRRDLAEPPPTMEAKLPPSLTIARLRAEMRDERDMVLL